MSGFTGYSQAKHTKQEVCSRSDCGHPSWPTLPARLSTQFFVTKMHTKKEGWLAKKCLDKGTWAHRRQEDALRGKNKVYVSANWKLLALVCKDWVLTCLVKMDDDRTGASGQLRAAALLIPMSVGSWQHPGATWGLICQSMCPSSLPQSVTLSRFARRSSFFSAALSVRASHLTLPQWFRI